MASNLFNDSRSKILWSLRLLVILCLLLVSQLALPRGASAATLASDDFNRADGGLGVELDGHLRRGDVDLLAAGDRDGRRDHR